MPGVFLLPLSLPIGRAIEEVVLLLECSAAHEWEGQIQRLPL